MRRSALALACLLFVSAPASADDALRRSLAILDTTIPKQVHPDSPARLLEMAGFDGVFQKFGETLAGSARASGLGDERFINAWEASTRKAFGRAELVQVLETSLAAGLDAGEAAGIEAFYASTAGGRIAALEAKTQAIAPERQLAAIAKGQATYLSASSRRRGQIEELMSLSNAELTFALLGEALRGMAVGLHVYGHGDIEVPWEDIDAGVATQLAGMEASLRDASRGVMAYTYSTLSDDELEAYLVFMRAPATRKFYGVATVVIGTSIRDTMMSLGKDVAERLAAVAI